MRCNNNNINTISIRVTEHCHRVVITDGIPVKERVLIFPNLEFQAYVIIKMCTMIAFTS